jgi:large subunit ribosomal protein L3
MGKHHPRRGSLAFVPKKKARRIYPKFKRLEKFDGIFGFAGYKAGMTQVIMIDDSNSPTKGEEIVVPVTIIEAPPLKVFGIRYYREGRVLYQKFIENLDKELGRKFNLPKKVSKENKSVENFDEVRLIVHTQPKSTGLKKTPEVFEIPFKGNVEGVLGKEIRAEEIFKPGEYVDVIAVTKGKGTVGPVQRFGIKKLPHKTEKKRRLVGTLGPWHPAKTSWRVPQAGQLGFQRRTELKKRLLAIKKAEEVNRAGGFKNYGNLKNDCLLISGSIPGHVKRLVFLRHSIIKKDFAPNPKILYIEH